MYEKARLVCYWLLLKSLKVAENIISGIGTLIMGVFRLILLAPLALGASVIYVAEHQRLVLWWDYIKGVEPAGEELTWQELFNILILIYSSNKPEFAALLLGAAIVVVCVIELSRD